MRDVVKISESKKQYIEEHAILRLLNNDNNKFVMEFVKPVDIYQLEKTSKGLKKYFYNVVEDTQKVSDKLYMAQFTCSVPY